MIITSFTIGILIVIIKGQHIVGMNPSYIDRTEEGDSDTPVTQSEGDNSTDASSNKEEKVDKEEKRLLHQEFLLDPDVKVKEWLNDRFVIAVVSCLLYRYLWLPITSKSPSRN